MDINLSNIQGKIKTAKILGKIQRPKQDSGDHDRLPPGQRLLTDKDEFPVLDLGVQPAFDKETYRFSVRGDIANSLELTLAELIAKFPKINLTADFHCVTKWSQFDITWAGFRYLDLEKYVMPSPDAKYLIQYGLDDYSTNVPLTDLRKENVIFAYELKGKPLPPEHGWPLRLIIPDLYGWKGSKFLTKIKFSVKDEPGFWEERGYHNHGDPWKEERYS